MDADFGYVSSLSEPLEQDAEALVAELTERLERLRSILNEVEDYNRRRQITE
jgi:hypothetical protein